MEVIAASVSDILPHYKMTTNTLTFSSNFLTVRQFWLPVSNTENTTPKNDISQPADSTVHFKHIDRHFLSRLL